MVSFLLARGEPRPALALAKDSYDLYRHRLGRDHPDTQTSARTLTDALHALAGTTRPAAYSRRPGSMPPRTPGEHR